MEQGLGWLTKIRIVLQPVNSALPQLQISLLFLSASSSVSVSAPASQNLEAVVRKALAIHRETLAAEQ